MYSVALDEPAAPTLQPAGTVKELVAPAQVTVSPVTVPAAVPALVRVRYEPVSPVETQVIVPEGPPFGKLVAAKFDAVTDMLAVEDDEPKMPNTKPPIATAAIRVTAMISTVAMIGEMAFLCAYFPFRIFIVAQSGVASYMKRGNQQYGFPIHSSLNSECAVRCLIP